jgi:hypothetical protein
MMEIQPSIELLELVILRLLADINHLNAKEMPPLYAAPQRGHLDVVRLMLKKGAMKEIEEKIAMQNSSVEAAQAATGQLRERIGNRKFKAG